MTITGFFRGKDNEYRLIGSQCQSYFRAIIFQFVKGIRFNLTRHGIPTLRLASGDTHTCGERTCFFSLIGNKINISQFTVTMCPGNVFRHNQITFQSICREVVLHIRNGRNQHTCFFQFIDLLFHFRRKFHRFRIHRTGIRQYQNLITGSARQYHSAIFYFCQTQ
ncbi:unknown [Bacteroides sp. CAG:754]|nr:unknown [Bacteroides sp. CAG:754]